MNFRYKRAMVALAAVLALYLIVQDLLLISNQRAVLHEQATRHAGHELEIVSTNLMENIIKRNYSTVEFIIRNWGDGHEEFAQIRAVAPNGFLIAEYKVNGEPTSPHTITQVIQHNGRHIATITAVIDLEIVDKSLKGLSTHLVISTVALMFILGIALWLTQRTVALKPLEQEIAIKDQEEARLKGFRAELEKRVDERTGELQRSEHSYRTLAVNLPGIVYRLHLEQQPASIQFFNETVRSMTGLSLDALDGAEGLKKYWAMVPRDEMLMVRREVRNAIRTGSPFEVQYRFIHADGHPRYFLERGRPIIDDATSLMHIDGVVLDVTASRLAEQEVKKLYSTLNTLVDHVPEGIVLLDSEHRIVLANPVAKNILRTLEGASRGDVLSTIGERAVEEFQVSPPYLIPHEVTAQTDDGRKLIFEIAARKITGGTAGTAIVMKDVTREREVADRVQARERLTAVGQLASGIAHDFSNVLTCVVGFSEMLLQDETISSDAKKQISAIFDSGQRATDLISQILDFSRPTVGELKPIDMSATVRDFLAFLDKILPEDIQVSVESEHEGLLVQADLTKVQQVLANLAVNARDAMPEGGSLRIRLRRLATGPKGSGAEAAPPLPEMPEGSWVAIDVSDTGQGIPKDLQAHIFDPFFTTKPQGKGTGLGLAQVYGIIKQHEGFISVSSEEGAGTTFSIYLPEALAEKTGNGRPEAQGTTGFPKAVSSRTVLVVEDDMVVRDLIMTVIKGMGHECLEAEDGREGLKVFKENMDRISLIVTDLVMPSMNGMVMTKKLQALKPDIPVIAVSGYPPKDEQEKLESSGLFKVYLKKPFSAKALAREVSGLLNA